MNLASPISGIMDAFNNGKIGSMIAVEGGHSMDSRLGVLRMFYDMGVRYMTLTHSCNTPWADNSYVDDDVPILNLTAYGEMVVKEMNRLGMLVDLSHVSHGVMNRAIEVSRAPVIFSHSSAYSVFTHNRNVPDDTLDRVKANGGVVMVNFYNGFIAQNASGATIDDVAAHINHIAKRIGPDYVGIGGDYDGVSQMPAGLEDVSKYPDLIDYLQNEDPALWTDENLQKLAGLNLIRVFKKAEEVRDSLAHEQPYQYWIPEEDLNAVDDENLWKCRTLLDNSSPSMIGELVVDK
ncbi:microsomal dipeptidase [Holotrichia oblita]|uniref:Microsomal dipeptidase n=1 Tax=Holotrichia oblita TaxID=644536 RepID=A0ACB9TMX4_HOLOL|nr:microsomal dipeptidase [Holotrichia oblita]